MKEEKVGDILLSVECGLRNYGLKEVAETYVKAFNKLGAYMILTYELREPVEVELVKVRKMYETVKQVKNQWVVERKLFDDSVVKRRLFVLVPTKVQKTPEHIMKLRPKVEVGIFEVEAGNE